MTTTIETPSFNYTCTIEEKDGEKRFGSLAPGHPQTVSGNKLIIEGREFGDDNSVRPQHEDQVMLIIRQCNREVIVWGEKGSELATIAHNPTHAESTEKIILLRHRAISDYDRIIIEDV